MMGRSILNRRAGFRQLLATLLSLVSLAVLASPQPQNAVEPACDMECFAARISNAPASARADLATIALEELSATYAEAALDAREDLLRHSAGPELRRWADAVEALAARLAQLAANVTSASSVHVAINAERSLYLVVDGEPVLVTGPLTTQQAPLESRIIQRYCSRHPCDNAGGLSAPAASLRPASTANPHWSFGDGGGPVCSGAGLSFAFRTSEQLPRKRQLCEQAIDELTALAEAIVRRAARGGRIEWEALSIHAAAGGGHEVAIDGAGTRLRLPLPLLARSPQLLSQARPWLAAKVDGGEPRVFIDNAEELLPVLSEP